MINSFPDTLDENMLFQDVDTSTKPLVDEFYRYYDAGNFAAITQLFINNPKLKNIIITSEMMQKIYDGVLSIERFYLNDIQQYLVMLVQFQGDYQSNVKYNKYNVVYYKTANLVEAFMCISEKTPIGTLPTNSSFFIPITLSGATFTPSVNASGIISWSNDKGLPNPAPMDIKGVSGSGLSPRGAWSNSTAYTLYDLVTYENKLWYALRANTNKIPSANPNDWLMYLQVSNVEGATTATTVTTVSVNGVIEVDVKPDYTPPALKSNVVSKDITTTWSGGAVPYTQSFSVSGITPASIIELSLSSSATEEQTKQFDMLNIKDGGQSTNSFTLRAWGKKNTVTIPIYVVVRKDAY